MKAGEMSPLTPQVPQVTNQQVSVRAVVASGLLMITISSLLISFNKYLITSGIFMFPLHLVFVHTISGSLFAVCGYYLCPSLYPTLHHDSKLLMDRNLLFGKLLPVAIAFAGGMVFSNSAYLHMSLAFQVMLKECNVFFVYLGSVAVGFKTLDLQQFYVLVVIVLFTLLDVKGELHCTLIGLLVQGTAQLCQVAMMLLQESLLSSRGVKLDPMTFVLLVLPCCAVVLAAVLAVILFTDFVFKIHVFGGAFATPSAATCLNAAPYLLANCALAFWLNISIAVFIKQTSAVASALANLVKDVFVVIISVIFLDEVVSKLQVVGFAGQLGGIFIYSLMQRFPKSFETHGALGGLSVIFQGSQGQSGETGSKVSGDKA